MRNDGAANNEKSMTGSGWRNERRTNVTPRGTVAIRSPSTRPLAQPQPGPWERAGRGQAAQSRTQDEDGDAAEEHAPAADAVGGTAGGDEQRAKHDAVAGDDPRQRGPAGRGERPLQLGEGHVDHRDIESGHEG